MITLLGGGPDQTPRFPKTLDVSNQHFKEHNSDVMFTSTLTTGMLAYNNVKRRMGHLLITFLLQASMSKVLCCQIQFPSMRLGLLRIDVSRSTFYKSQNVPNRNVVYEQAEFRRREGGRV